MDDITLVAVNWNQKKALELFLKSYIKHHHSGYPLRLLLADNGSTDGSKEWLKDNKVPFINLPKNLGHDGALSVVYGEVKTKYILLCDSDIEFLDNVHIYTNKITGNNISVGELLDNDIYNGQKLKPRIATWFWMFNYEIMREAKINVWRGSSDWLYNTGAWYWEQMLKMGYSNYNLVSKSPIKGSGIGNEYDKFNHFGSVSWDLELLPEHKEEILLRRKCIELRLLNYKEIDPVGKLTA